MVASDPISRGGYWREGGGFRVEEHAFREVEREGTPRPKRQGRLEAAGCDRFDVTVGVPGARREPDEVAALMAQDLPDRVLRGEALHCVHEYGEGLSGCQYPKVRLRGVDATRRFAEYLEQQMRARDLSVREMARLLEIDVSNLSRYLNGKQVPGRRNIQRMARGLGITPAQINEMLPVEAQQRARDATVDTPPALSLPPSWRQEITAAVEAALKEVRATQARPEPPRGFWIRRLDEQRVSASRALGHGEDWAWFQPPPDLEGGLDPERFVQLPVIGACLEPVIHEGDEIVVDRRGELVEGAIVVAHHDGDLLVKRLALVDDAQWLVADDGTRHEIDDSTRIHGVAIRVVRDLRVE